MIALAVIAWIFCGLAAAGLLFADTQGLDPPERGPVDIFISYSASLLFGPMALVAALCFTNFGEAGWKLPRPSKRQA